MRLKCFIAMLMCGALGARGGNLRTFDGKTFSGTVTLDADLKLTMTTTSGGAARHSLDDALWVNFASADAGKSRKWFSQDIASSAPPGRSRVQGSTMSITGGGVGIDQFHMTHQVIRGDVTIRAKAASVGRSDPQASAGLVFRASTEPNAACVYVAFTADGNGVVYAKPASGGASTTTFAGKAPGWLKLSREGDAIAAMSSDDGKTWTAIWNGSLAMPAQMLVGVFAHSNNRNMLSTGSFDNVTVETRDLSEDGFKGVILREGSKIACDILSANDSTTHVKRPLDPDLPIPMSEISRIVWRGVNGKQSSSIPQGKTGVLLTGGDFFEGTLAGLTDSKARISSVIFGLREFEASKIQALCLSAPKNAPTRYIIKLSDGSTLLTDKISIDKSNLAAEIGGVGLVRFGRDKLTEIRAGESRYQSLADVRPSKSSDIQIVMPAGIEASIRSTAAERFVGIGAGGSVSWSVPGDAKIFSARLGVPDGVLPSTALRFVVKLDDREIYRSPEMTSLTDEISVAIPVSSAKAISVSVESAAGSFGGLALLADPAMVK